MTDYKEQPSAKFPEWVSVYQFCNQDGKETRRLLQYMQTLGMRGDIFRPSLLFDIQREMREHENIKA